MDNTQAQNEELLVLESIYDDKYFIVDGMAPPCGRFSAHVPLPDHFYVKLKRINVNENQSDCSKLEYEEMELNYLPPINLCFEYPESYPSDSAPKFLISCSWLSYEQLSRLCEKLDVLWNESNGEVILFQWIQFLKEETLNFLNIEECLDVTELSDYKLNFRGTTDCESEKSSSETIPPTVKPSISGGNGSRDRRAFLEIADGKVLRKLLKDYNDCKKAEHFCESWHLCNVCFASKQGSDFVTFRACHHFFCKECMKSFFELLINEGNVNSLNCPHDKCTTEADGTLVKQIVSKDHFERYDSLLLSRTLDTMADIAYCPRKACQCALLIDVSGRIGTCPACKFVFCPFCKVAYHGIAPCNFNPAMKQQISKGYLQGDAFKKAELENRYGKRTVKSIVEEVLSENWIGSNSKHCPQCNISIEKNDGCNKMTCFRCGAFFCWLCTTKLKASNPYAHYSEMGSECYDKLFPEGYVDEEFILEPGEFLVF